MFSSRLFEDLPTWALFLEVFLAGLVVVLLASRLTRLADRISDELNLGKAWTGMLLLATVTSLPEVVTGGTAVAIGNPDLAFATLFGSCSFNILLIVLINAVIGGGSILGRATGAHTLTSSFGIILLSLALLGIALVDKFADTQLGVAQGCELVIAGTIVVCYCWFIRLTFRFEHADRPLVEMDEQRSSPRSRGLIGKIVAIAAALVVSAWWLTQTGDVLAVHHIELIGRPLGSSFVGAAFLAVATSLPEIVTCLAAVKLGHLDMALGNIFGSNMFNVLVIPMLKVISLLRGDALLMHGPSFHPLACTIAALLPVLLTGITVAALTYQTKRRMRRLGVDSLLLAGAYAAGMCLLFMDAS
ncbi:MAG: sodium:calcium antiporter [Planctomycetes bacterium]|nr:sodium:calcium antiporter [Planctomycetota bacterium]